ncbi:MAG: thiamine-phosphate kinase [Xanthobacteraceae bacterium]|uniref:thiamine-phosphate kinase n=1 Tax=Pseudolabrys sp. TaxID=1960880 RepID=UPI003D0CC5CB
MVGPDDAGSGEDRLIARFFKPLASAPGALALTDDAAFVAPPPGCDLVLTADMIVGGVHFLADDPAELIAKKAMRVNLSDLAAKGAAPFGFLVSIALPQGVDEAWLASFASGLKADADAYRCPLYGGDTTRTPGPVTISVTMAGTVPHGTMVKRAGAKAGDKIYVSGTIGDAALGLAVQRDDGRRISAGARDYLVGRYRLPQPRNALAEAVRTHASAAMDVSDGLAGDLAKLCRVSGVAARIETERVPLSDAARELIATDAALLEAAITGGDDYEIVCAVPPEKISSFESEAAAARVPVAAIGEVAGGQGLDVRGPDGAPMALRRTSFSHF